MDPEIQNKTKDYSLHATILASALLIAGALMYAVQLRYAAQARNANVSGSAQASLTSIEEAAVPAKGVVLPVRWSDLGVKMIEAGVIDKQKLEAIYAQRGGLRAEDKKLIESTDNGVITVTPQNAGYLLNLFWALGLGNKNAILENGPMADPRYGDPSRFASTGGWTIANGNATDHYSRHLFIVLTKEQQDVVERVAKNIYRPCCNNATYFPDCNHGMAMLGLLELMAAQGVSEQNMYKAALAVNSYWFPDNYLTIAGYMKQKGIEWKDVSPKEILGANYSSASGYAKVASQVVQPQRPKSGCGI